MADNYLTRYDSIIWSKEAAKFSLVTLMFVVIPAGVAISARFFKKEVRFFASIVFFFSIFILFQLTEGFAQWLDFNWPNSSVSATFIGILEIVLLVGLFWGLFYLASNMSMKKITLVSVLFVAGISGLVFYSKQRLDIELYPQSAAIVLPKNLLLVQAGSIAQQEQSNKSLFEMAAQEARNLNKEAND